MAVDLGSTFKDLIDEINNKAKAGERGFGFVASVSRSSFTEAQWTTYGSMGHTENWSDTADIRNDCRIGDLFIIVGTATDTGNAHMAIYRSDTASGALHGECIAHFIALRGKDGANAIPTIQQGTGEKAEVFNGGQAAQASGDYSHAEGANTVASGLGSHAEGGTTQASGIGTHAEGVQTVASGDYSHAEGVEAVASGVGSHAEGANTVASGMGSHAEGGGTVASGFLSHAMGIYNDYSNMGPGDELSLSVIYCIGNGLGNTMRSNAFEVWFNGRCRAPTWDISDVASHPKNLITVEYAAAALSPIQEAINGMVKQVKVNGETKSPDSNGLVDLGTISSGDGGVVTETAFPNPAKTYLLLKGSTFNMYSDTASNVTFEWGDGTTSFFEQASGNITHTYTDGKEYHQVAISGYPSFGSCFEDEEGIIKAIIGNTVTQLSGTFWSCSNLESVTIPNSVTEIGSSTFNSCTNLKTITIPESVITLGSYVFNYCSSLEEVRFLSDIPLGTAFGDGIFDNCPLLERIIVPGEIYDDYTTQLSAYKHQIVYEIYSSSTKNFVEKSGVAEQHISNTLKLDNLYVDGRTVLNDETQFFGPTRFDNETQFFGPTRFDNETQFDDRAIFDNGFLADCTGCSFVDTTVEISGGSAYLKLQDSIGEPGQVVTVGDYGIPVWKYPSSGGGGNSELVQFQVTNIRMYEENYDDENYDLYANISIRVLTGELHKGDMIQLGVVKGVEKYNLDGHKNRVNHRTTTRFRTIESMTLTQGEVDSYNDKVKDIFTLRVYVGTFSKASHYLNTDMYYNVPLFRTHTNSSSQRRPLILRIVRPVPVGGRATTWNKLISNKVQVLTSFTHHAPSLHLSAL